MIDTAHLYTGGESEKAIGRALSSAPSSVIVATKGGYGDAGRGKPEILRQEIEQSLASLRVGRIALYYLHRVDPETPIEESLGAIKEYVDRGAIERVGISKVDIPLIERARKVVPIAAVQNEYNLAERKYDDVVDYCAREGIVFVPYYPLRADPGRALREIANRHQATPRQVMLAWLLKRSPAMLPIPGTLSLAHLQENLGALSLELSDAEFDVLARGDEAVTPQHLARPASSPRRHSSCILTGPPESGRLCHRRRARQPAGFRVSMGKLGSRRVAGSGVSHPLGAAPLGAVEREMSLQVTVVLRPRRPRAHDAGPVMHPAERPILSADELAEWYDPGDHRIRLVRQFADANGLSVIEVSRARHDVVLEAKADQFARAFGVTLRYFEAEGAHYYAYDERVRLPRELRAVTENVLGLDSIPTHRTHAGGATRRACAIPTLERQYCFPAVDARGRRIALLEFGGGFSSEDITAYANRLGIAEPRVTPVSVAGAAGQHGGNAPLDRAIAAGIARDWKASVPFATLTKKYGNDLGAFIASMEVTMDIELALALGGGAAVDVYFARAASTDGGADYTRRSVFRSAAQAARTHRTDGDVDLVGRVRIGVRPGPTADDRAHPDRGTPRGCGRLCSSGDWGSVNASPKPGVPAIPNVNFPASSPSVLACGGTRLLPGGSPTTRVPKSRGMNASSAFRWRRVAASADSSRGRRRKATSSCVPPHERGAPPVMGTGRSGRTGRRGKCRFELRARDHFRRREARRFRNERRGPDLRVAARARVRIRRPRGRGNGGLAVHCRRENLLPSGDEGRQRRHERKGRVLPSRRKDGTRARGSARSTAKRS